MNKQFLKLLSLQIREFYRYPELLFWALVFPVATALTLGYAFDKESMKQQVIYLVVPESEAPVELALFKSRLEQKGIENKYSALVSKRKAAIAAYQSGKAVLVIEKNRYKDYEYFFHESRNDSYQAYLELQANTNLTSVKFFADKGFRYLDFLIPGLLAMAIMNSAVWGIGYALIEMRMKKTLRRLVVTPMKKWHFLTSMIVARLGITLLESLILLSIIDLFFDVSWPKNPGLALMVFLSGNLAFGAIAILMASKAATTRSGNGLANAVTIPMLVVSGIFFSYVNFPDWLHPLLEFLPLTLIADSFRSLFNDTFDVATIQRNIMTLMIWFLSCMACALRTFRWS